MAQLRGAWPAALTALSTLDTHEIMVNTASAQQQGKFRAHVTVAGKRIVLGTPQDWPNAALAMFSAWEGSRSTQR